MFSSSKLHTFISTWCFLHDVLEVEGNLCEVIVLLGLFILQFTLKEEEITEEKFAHFN